MRTEMAFSASAAPTGSMLTFASAGSSMNRKTMCLLVEGANKTSHAKMDNLQVNVNCRSRKAMQTPALKNSNGAVSVTSTLKTEPEISSSSGSLSSSTIQEFPSWIKWLLPAIFTRMAAGAAAEQRKEINPTADEPPLGQGRLVNNGKAVRQNLLVRSFDVGPDSKMTIVALGNHLQETAINHARTIGFFSDGFGSTPGMSKMGLAWVAWKMQFVVHRYPSWGEIVQVDTCFHESGRNSLHVEWVFSDRAGETLILASSVYVMMNKNTRKIAKIPKEVKEKLASYLLPECHPIIKDRRKFMPVDISNADYIRTGLIARWNDLDINQHVNNVKYMEWLVETAPPSIMDSHALCSLTVEFRKECYKDSVVLSLSREDDEGTELGSDNRNERIELVHLIRLDDGEEVARGRTTWKPK